MLSTEKKEVLRERVFMALGHASMCWEKPEGAGAFDSSLAKKIGDELVREIFEIYDESWRVPQPKQNHPT